MKILRYMALLVAALAFGSSGVEGAINTLASGTFNGHEYKLISDSDYPNLYWPDANISVGSLGTGWYLATITSQEENNFVSNLIAPLGHVWLGGYQPLNEHIPSSNWTWVTGETFSTYTNWDLPWEPNDYNAAVTGVYEQYLAMLPGGKWNDASGPVNLYIAERSPVAPVPIPGALVLFGSGLLGLAGIGRKRFKK
jgi:hypothetical protein